MAAAAIPSTSTPDTCDSSRLPADGTHDSSTLFGSLGGREGQNRYISDLVDHCHYRPQGPVSSQSAEHLVNSMGLGGANPILHSSDADAKNRKVARGCPRGFFGGSGDRAPTPGIG